MVVVNIGVGGAGRGGRRRGGRLGGALVLACLIKVPFDHGDRAGRILAKESRG
jgi:hypothetical protein